MRIFRLGAVAMCTARRHETTMMVGGSSASFPAIETYGFTHAAAQLSQRCSDELLAITDFDLTRTTGDSEQCHDVLGVHGPEALRSGFERLLDFSTPFPTELQGDGWWTRANEILIEHGAQLTRSHVDESVRRARIQLRPGALQMLRKLKELQIPVLIVSAGAFRQT